MTNGGGVLEQDKAKSLEKLLDVSIKPSQILLSHTPMKNL